MVLLLAAASVIVAGGITIVALLKRREKNLSDNDLSDSARANNLHIVKKLSDEERATLTTAFLAGEDFQWLVSGKPQVETSDETQTENHKIATSYLVDCVVSFAENYGHVIVARDSATNEFLGSICVVPPYSKTWLYTLHFYRSVLALGFPPPLNMGKDTAARFDAFTDTVGAQHNQIMKDRPHWYIVNLGVSEKAQGKGVGSSLLRAAFELAGEHQPLYLECHDGNVPYYKSKGFSVGKRYMMTPTGIENPTSFPFNGMVRH